MLAVKVAQENFKMEVKRYVNEDCVINRVHLRVYNSNTVQLVEEVVSV